MKVLNTTGTLVLREENKASTNRRVADYESENHFSI